MLVWLKIIMYFCKVVSIIIVLHSCNSLKYNHFEY